MKIQSLASGSKGNSLLVDTEDSCFLIDQGLSAKQLTLRMEKCGRSPKELKAICISHNHGDHVNGVRVLANKYHIAVYANKNTLDAMKVKGALKDVRSIHIFETGKVFYLNKTEIHPFSVSHDAEETVNFLIKSQDKYVGIFTDLGHVSHLVKQKALLCHYLYLEANHDIDMLKNGPYPIAVQQRVRGKFGHLSNDQSLDLLESIVEKGQVQGVSFIHLSEKNNHPDLLKKAIQSRLEKSGKNLNFEICTQHEPGTLQEIK